MNTKERYNIMRDRNKLPLNDLTNQFKNDYYESKLKDRSFALHCWLIGGWVIAIGLVIKWIVGSL